MIFRNVSQQAIEYLNQLFIDLHLLMNKVDDKRLNLIKDHLRGLMSYLATVADIDDLRKAIEENDNLPENVRGEYMTAAEYYIQTGEKRGVEQGRAEERRDLAVNALKKGLEVEFVADLTGLAIESVEELKSKLD